MRFHLGPAVAVLALASPACAQSFEETAAYIMKGLEEKPNVYVKKQTGAELVYQDAKPNESGNSSTYTLKTLRPCVIELTDRVTSADPSVVKLASSIYTIDFNTIYDFKPKKGPGDEMRYVELVGGTYTMCSPGLNRCYDPQNLLVWSKQIASDRFAKSVAYMKSAFCRGRAF